MCCSHRVSRRLRSLVAAPEPRLLSPDAHGDLAPPPPVQRLGVGTYIGQQGEEKEISEADAAVRTKLLMTPFSGMEVAMDTTPDETVKKTVSVQVQMTPFPSTRSAEVQTDRSPPPPAAPLILPPPVSLTPVSLTPGPSPSSPVVQQESQDGGATSALELAGHQYLSVTDVEEEEEEQEESLVEVPVQPEDDSSSVKVPIIRETIPIARKISCHQEYLSPAVSMPLSGHQLR